MFFKKNVKKLKRGSEWSNQNNLVKHKEAKLKKGKKKKKKSLRQYEELRRMDQRNPEFDKYNEDLHKL